MHVRDDERGGLPYPSMRLVSPRHLPLVKRNPVDTAEDVYESLVDTVEQPEGGEAEDSGDTRYDLECGDIRCRKRDGTLYFAAWTRNTGCTPFVPMTEEEAEEWIGRMLSPMYAARGWRLRVVIAALREARKALAEADAELDRRIDFMWQLVAQTSKKSKQHRDACNYAASRVAKQQLKADIFYRAVSRLTYVLRYLLTQRRRLRVKSSQLSFAFAA